jgi:hypothetical protein
MADDINFIKHAISSVAEMTKLFLGRLLLFEQVYAFPALFGRLVIYCRIPRRMLIKERLMKTKFHQRGHLPLAGLLGSMLVAGGITSQAALANEPSPSITEQVLSPGKVSPRQRKVTLAKEKETQYPTKPQKEVRTLRQK